MGYDLLLEIIENIGHISLFFVLCLGLIGLPIPNEAVALTAGALSEAGILNYVLAYLMVFLGICSSMSFNYSLGRFTSNKLSKWFSKRQNLGKFIEQSNRIIDKYGPYPIPICAFFPFLRHATPYLMGVNQMRFIRFMIFAFPTAMVWSAIYFTLGLYVGDQIPEIIQVINRYESIVFIVLSIVASLFLWYKIRQYKLNKQNKQKHNNNTVA